MTETTPLNATETPMDPHVDSESLQGRSELKGDVVVLNAFERMGAERLKNVAVTEREAALDALLLAAERALIAFDWTPEMLAERMRIGRGQYGEFSPFTDNRSPDDFARLILEEAADAVNYLGMRVARVGHLRDLALQERAEKDAREFFRIPEAAK